MEGRVAMAVLLALTAGCFARNAAEPRFFRPDAALLREPPEAMAQGTPSRSAVAIRLRSVDAGPFVRERIVWRVSSVEYGVYEQWRWREVPASYVERALRSALRRGGRVRLSDDVFVPSLRVELVAFDEVLAPTHTALVEAVVSLRDKNGQILLDGPFSAENPIAGSDPAAMARAMGGALDAVASEIAADPAVHREATPLSKRAEAASRTGAAMSD